MLEIFTETVAGLQSEAAAYPAAIQIWMRVMGFSFLFSIVFVRSRVGARWILIALVVNIAGLIVGKIAFPELSRAAIGTYVHVLFWPGILWAVWRNFKLRLYVASLNSTIDRVYLGWLVWASLLMAVSLAFDFRNLVAMWI